MRSALYIQEKTTLYGIIYNPNMYQIRRESGLQI